MKTTDQQRQGIIVEDLGDDAILVTEHVQGVGVVSYRMVRVNSAAADEYLAHRAEIEARHH
jgi:hypothetical protein